VVNPSFLVEAADTDAEKVSDLIMSMEEDNMSLALSLVEGGGLPEQLFTELFIINKLSEDKENSKRALQLLKAKAGPELMAVLKNRAALKKSTYNWFSQALRNELEEKIREFTENSGLDLGKLAYALFCKSEFFLNIVLENADKKIRKLALSKAIKNDCLLMNSYDCLNHFPIDLLDFDNLKEITFFAVQGDWSEGVWVENTSLFIPDDIDKLQNLEKLDIRCYIFRKLPLKAFSNMPNLKYLSLVVDNDFNLEELYSLLPNCEIDVHKYKI
jgi:hypothetical protein